MTTPPWGTGPVPAQQDPRVTVGSRPPASLDDTALQSPNVTPSEADTVHEAQTTGIDEGRPGVVLSDADTTAPMEEAPPSTLGMGPGRTGAVQDRSEALFEDEMDKGSRAIEEGDYQQAVHHFSVASALRPDSPKARERLRESRRLRDQSAGPA